MKKIVFANIGKASQGKTSSIREVYKCLSAKYPNNVTLIHNGSDIMAAIEINGVLVGIESQGDPYSRMIKSMDEFVRMGCEIIICACRTYGSTRDKVCELKTKFDYEVIWVPNPRTSNVLLQGNLNEDYSDMVVTQIERYVTNYSNLHKA